MKTHAFHVAILLIILIGGAVTFFTLDGNGSAQLAVGIVTSIGYIAWGVLHHYLSGDLHPKVVIEYMLLGAVAIALLALVIRP